MVQLIWVTGVYKSPKLKKFGPRFCIQDLVSCRKTVPRIVPHCTSYCAALYLVLCRTVPRIVPHCTSYCAATVKPMGRDLVLCHTGPRIMPPVPRIVPHWTSYCAANMNGPSHSYLRHDTRYPLRMRGPRMLPPASHAAL